MSLKTVGLLIVALGIGAGLAASIMLPVNIFPEVAQTIRDNPHDVLANGELMVTAHQIQIASWNQYMGLHIAVFTLMAFGFSLVAFGKTKKEE